VIPAEVPYGRWPSPISAQAAAAATVAVDEVAFAADGALRWLQSRPDQGDRTALIGWSPAAGRREISTDGVDVGSAVYGYGGGTWAAGGGTVWFCEQGDGRVWHGTGDHAATPVDLGRGSAGARYADLEVTPDGRDVVCVRERDIEGRSRTDVVRVGPSGSTEVLAAGADFHAAPRLDPLGGRLAWVSWSDPLMPWDGTRLQVADLRRPGGDPVLVAGGVEESVLQPEWSPAGELHFLSDRSGWWNLYRWRDGRVQSVISAEADMAAAPWELGYATYAFLPHGRIAVLLYTGPRARLAIHDPRTGELRDVPLPYTSIKPYLSSHHDQVALIGSNPTQGSTVAVIDTTTGAHNEITAPPTLADPRYLSTPELLSIPTRDGGTAYALYYPPTNPDVTAPAGSCPPLIVRPHPGPTSGVSERLDPAVQFFTSRGFAVCDLDYRGSAGYGRAYRQALDGHWGVLDVTDAVDAVDHLAALGRADPDRVVISGASAGGYTALRALATTRRFAAGTARSAIADPAIWRRTAPRFQRHHTTDLIGAWPQTAETYRQRSALHDPDRITAPVLLVHGGRDRIAPLGPIEELAVHLFGAGTDCTLIVHPDDGHSLGPAATATSLDAELKLYQSALVL
jgi:dipeptidyl aminopeptidase/acylaminoacyl peptidase